MSKKKGSKNNCGECDLLFLIAFAFTFVMMIYHPTIGILMGLALISIGFCMTLVVCSPCILVACSVVTAVLGCLALSAVFIKTIKTAVAS